MYIETGSFFSQLSQCMTPKKRDLEYKLFSYFFNTQFTITVANWICKTTFDGLPFCFALF